MSKEVIWLTRVFGKDHSVILRRMRASICLSCVLRVRAAGRALDASASEGKALETGIPSPLPHGASLGGGRRMAFVLRVSAGSCAEGQRLPKPSFPSFQSCVL